MNAHRVSDRGRGRRRGREDYYHLVENAGHRVEAAATDENGRWPGAGRRRSAAAAAFAGGDIRRRRELKAGPELEDGMCCGFVGKRIRWNYD